MDTFVIRVYSESGRVRPGRVEHVASGGVRFFHTLDEVADVLSDLLADSEPPRSLEPGTTPAADRQ